MSFDLQLLSLINNCPFGTFNLQSFSFRLERSWFMGDIISKWSFIGYLNQILKQRERNYFNAWFLKSIHIKHNTTMSYWELIYLFFFLLFIAVMQFYLDTTLNVSVVDNFFIILTRNARNFCKNINNGLVGIVIFWLTNVNFLGCC